MVKLLFLRDQFHYKGGSVRKQGDTVQVHPELSFVFDSVRRKGVEDLL
jgi:hypothetical protein